jgi:hypothetical protein
MPKSGGEAPAIAGRGYCRAGEEEGSAGRSRPERSLASRSMRTRLWLTVAALATLLYTVGAPVMHGP